MLATRTSHLRALAVAVLIAAFVVFALRWNSRGLESAAIPAPNAGAALAAPAPNEEAPETRNAVELPEEAPGDAEQAPAGRHVVVVKRALDGAPVEEAGVFVSDDLESWSEAGRTKESGALELPRAERLRAVGVVARGFLREVRELRAEETWPLEILLQPGATICGQVLRADGAPGVPEVRVVALEVTQVDSAAVVAQKLARKDPRIRSATVDSRGDFCIVGLRTNEAVGLAAGGEGFVQQAMWIPAQAGDAGIELLVSQLYGARLVPTDLEGKALASGDVGALALRWWSDGAAGQLVQVGLAAWLATGDTDLMQTDSISKVALSTAPIELEELAPFTYEANAPGYATARGTLALPRLRASPTTLPIPMERTAAGLAALTVRLRHAAPSAAAMAFPRARLQLEGPDGSIHKFALEPSDDGLHRVEGVPLGRYRARLLVFPTKTWHPADPAHAPEVNVRPEGSELEFPLAPVGEARLQVIQADGTPFTDRIRYSFGSVTGEPAKFDVLVTTSMLPPYCLSGLAPGRYFVTVEIPKVASETDGSSTAVLEVGPNGGGVELRFRALE